MMHRVWHRFSSSSFTFTHASNLSICTLSISIIHKSLSSGKMQLNDYGNATKAVGLILGSAGLVSGTFKLPVCC
jgi:hypothetical protein